jgi:hypothetical protein
MSLRRKQNVVIGTKHDAQRVVSEQAARSRGGGNGGIDSRDPGEGDDLAVPRKPTSEWTLWVVAGSCALHPAEEYLTGWQGWAKETLGITMPRAAFIVANAVVFLAALLLARVGWRRPALSLVIPAATLANAIFFHILPTVVQHRVSPGVYTATLLYLPFSSWAFLGAWRDGVPKRAMGVALISGLLLMTAVVLGARSMSGGSP